MTPLWLIVAQGYLGVEETPGKLNSPVIQRWLRNLRAWWSDDATPWCATFVAECFLEVDIDRPAAWYRAKAWLDWGRELTVPRLGCVIVYERKGGGHVGFVVGRDASGRIMTLGGNQGDRVSIMPFDEARVVGYRWPLGEPLPEGAPLPVIDSTTPPSTQEG